MTKSHPNPENHPLKKQNITSKYKIYSEHKALLSKIYTAFLHMPKKENKRYLPKLENIMKLHHNHPSEEELKKKLEELNNLGYIVITSKNSYYLTEKGKSFITSNQFGEDYPKGGNYMRQYNNRYTNFITTKKETLKQIESDKKVKRINFKNI